MALHFSGGWIFSSARFCFTLHPMLTRLRVKNIALVENISIDFKPGLNVITGETGAGKSILMGALALVLGERADKSIIRTGEDACGSEACFHLADSADVDEWLTSLGLEPCEDGQLVIRRIIKEKGAGQNMVNDQPVTLQALKRLGQMLVDMHGPHEHQSLLNREKQIDILDAFGHLWKERGDYEEAFRKLQDLKLRKEELLADDTDVAERIDMLKFKIEEIESLKLSEEEDAEIEQEHAVSGNAQRIMELSGALVNVLTESEECVFNRLTERRRDLEELARLMPEAEAWQEELDALIRQTQELSAAVSNAVDRIDLNPTRFQWLEERLTAYQRMKRKYGPTIADVLNTLEESKIKLHDLESRQEQLDMIDADIAAADETARSLGSMLSKKRGTAGKELAKAITRELQGLGFPHSAFAVQCEPCEPTHSGMDDLEFGFQPNVGEAMRPLRHIASSGEISRVMLATKAVLAAHDRIPVLVFDEIDANLGGEMGHAVGRKLADVAGSHQVLCITHLPQVAAHGTHHYAVSKYVDEGRTFSQVAPLDEKARIGEIARMLGGETQGEISLQHAQEMLGKARL